MLNKDDAGPLGVVGTLIVIGGLFIIVLIFQLIATFWEYLAQL